MDLKDIQEAGSIKWVGEKTAKKIIKTFGDDTVYILEKEPEKSL